MRLSVCGIEFSYGDRKALEDVSFSLEEGEFAALLGPNGSGKTTLLRTIARILRPKIGAVYIEGTNIHHLPTRESAKLAGVVPQETIIAFDFTALDMVLMGRHPYSRRFVVETKEDLEMAKHAMELAGCWHLASRNINELSSGERQKVIIARALAQDPKVLLLDEPTSHLDVANQLEILDLIGRLCQDKRMTVVSVFHDLNLPLRNCGKAIIMNQGRVAACGVAVKVLIPELIAEVYGVKAQVIDSRTNGHVIIPLGLVSDSSV